jgi:hypothetical protein
MPKLATFRAKRDSAFHPQPPLPVEPSSLAASEEFSIAISGNILSIERLVENADASRLSQGYLITFGHQRRSELDTNNISAVWS